MEEIVGNWSTANQKHAKLRKKSCKTAKLRKVNALMARDHCIRIRQDTIDV